MSRYIDADALIDDLEHDIAVDEDILNYVGTVGAERENAQFDKDCKQNTIDLLLRQPTIDAVSVVRCKDCKHWHDHITTTWCSRGAELRPQESGWIKRNADDFCSYGERKESE